MTEPVKPRWIEVCEGTEVMRVPNGFVIRDSAQLDRIEGPALATALAFVPCHSYEFHKFVEGGFEPKRKSEI